MNIIQKTVAKAFKIPVEKPNKDYRYEFDYQKDEIISRARDINAMSIEAATSLTALQNFLAVARDQVTDDAAEQINEAVSACAASIAASQEAFAFVIKLAKSTTYRERA